MLSWNVNGLIDDKKCNKDFLFIINNYNIIFLYETWTNKNSIIEINGNESFNFYRKFQHRNARKPSGGVEGFFKFEADVYICGAMSLLRTIIIM